MICNNENNEHNFATIVAFCMLQLLSHVSIVMSNALGLNDDSPLVFNVEATTYTCYIVDLGGSPHEAPIPCAFKMCSTSSNKSKTSDAKNAFDDWYSPHSNVEPS
jgi:hypothetical protein